MKNIIIPQPEKLEEIKEAMASDGADKIHILSDFDGTLTNLYHNGKKVGALMALLDNNYLTPEYHRRYKELHDKYFPVELDTKITLEKKKKLMAEWWRAVFDLLIKFKLNKKDLEKLVASQNIKFRDGFDEFTDLLRDKNIPLIIMSSTGLGGNTIAMYLEKQNKFYPNIHIIANTFEWNENGDAIAVKEPIIHLANKNELSIRNLPVFNLIKHRKNIILLGDAIEDVGMAEGFNYENLIKVGFFNNNETKNLEAYKSHYDIVILNDSGLEYVNELLKEICH